MADIKYYYKDHVPTTIPQPIYDPMVKQYVEGEKDGYSCLLEVGQTNMYEVIQASKDDCDVYSLLKRYSCGDLDALNQRVGSFIDVSEVPSDVFAMKEYLKSVSAKFDALPGEVKALYNHSPSVFFEFLQSNGQATELQRISDVVSKISRGALDGDQKGSVE